MDFLFRLNNPQSFSTHQDQFFRKLLGCCIVLGGKETEWNHSKEILMTSDEQYYVYKKYCSMAKEWQVVIYDRKAKTYKRSFNLDYFYMNAKIFSKKNILFFSGKNGSCLYNIEQDTLYDFGKHIRISDISSDENYIMGYGEGGLYIWNIIDFNKITCRNIYRAKMTKFCAKFSPDNTFLSIIPYCCHKLILYALHDLKELDSCDVAFNSNTQLCFVTNKNIVVGSYCNEPHPVQGFEIEKTEKSISLKKLFLINGFLRSQIHETLFITNLENNHLLTDLNGTIIQGSQAINQTINVEYFDWSVSGKIVIFSNEKDTILIHRLFDKDGKYLDYRKNTLDIGKGLFFRFNRDYTVIYEWDKQIYMGLDGAVLGTLKANKHTGFFHPNGRSILYPDKNGKNKKYSLYPKDADEHLKKITYKPLTAPQYMALEKICKEVEAVRKEKSIPLKIN
jgi:hypothetical protein